MFFSLAVPRLFMRRAIWLAVLAMLPACQRDATAFRSAEPTRNARPDCNDCEILFIGSSYLSYVGNTAPDIVASFAAAAGKNATVVMRSVGGWKLADHLASQQTLELIAERDWDYIVLQGNAAYMSKAKWHPYIVPYLEQFRALIKQRSPKTCVVYMMPWAYLDGLGWIDGETDTWDQMQENLRRESVAVAGRLDIAVAPAGWAWYRAVRANYVDDLYLTDLHHQSQAGAYLTACVFYSTLFLEPAPEIDFDWRTDNDPPYLHDLAFRVVTDSLATWNIY